MVNHFIREYNSIKQKKIKLLLFKAIADRKEQRELLMNNLIQPLTDCIKVTEEVIKSQKPIESYIYQTKMTSKQVKGFLKRGEK